MYLIVVKWQILLQYFYCKEYCSRDERKMTLQTVTLRTIYFKRITQTVMDIRGRKAETRWRAYGRKITREGKDGRCSPWSNNTNQQKETLGRVGCLGIDVEAQTASGRVWPQQEEEEERSGVFLRRKSKLLRQLPSISSPLWSFSVRYPLWRFAVTCIPIGVCGGALGVSKDFILVNIPFFLCFFRDNTWQLITAVRLDSSSVGPAARRARSLRLLGELGRSLLWQCWVCAASEITKTKALGVVRKLFCEAQIKTGWLQMGESCWIF